MSDQIYRAEDDDQALVDADGRPAPMVVLPRTALRDNRLSLRARGILAMLVSLPPGSRWTLATLPGWVPTPGETTEDMQVAWDELVAAGYVTADGVVQGARA
ncbi:hypothetical protein [Candidatus Frankia alpina]|uniref:Uncharacterized protein n=1 Tax=Candidatus Frankia alpina TaxID=2699483 RepID=A0A4S5ESY7_9ACTN|nr:hypothetical protein [Candidatus Frankia alpina]THJ75383.1 hypothetical protein E7Y31_05795 [Candidatus Frankia alpina]